MLTENEKRRAMENIDRSRQIRADARQAYEKDVRREAEEQAFADAYRSSLPPIVAGGPINSAAAADSRSAADAAFERASAAGLVRILGQPGRAGAAAASADVGAAAADLEARCKANWNASEKLRAEFNQSFGAYLAFERALARGQVRIFKGSK